MHIKTTLVIALMFFNNSGYFIWLLFFLHIDSAKIIKTSWFSIIKNALSYGSWLLKVKMFPLGLTEGVSRAYSLIQALWKIIFISFILFQFPEYSLCHALPCKIVNIIRNSFYPTSLRRLSLTMLSWKYSCELHFLFQNNRPSS